MRHDTMAIGRHFHPRRDRDILHLRGAFQLERLNPREVQLFLAGQALSHIYTPKLATFREKSGLAWAFAPLVYIAILGRRDEPAQRLVALVQSVAQLVQSVADMIGQRRR